MNKSLLQLTLSHLKEYLREPGAIFWSFGFPILMALGLGLAFSGKKELVHGVAIIPGSSVYDTNVKKTFNISSENKDTIIEKRFENDQGSTRYVFHITNWNDAEVKIKRGTISAILTEENGEITYHYDPQNPEGELIQIQLSNYFTIGNLGRHAVSIEPLDKVGLRYIDFLIPGLLSMGAMMSIMWGVCYTLIEKRSKKLLRRMVATPMRKSDYLISQWLSRLTITFFETLTLILFSYAIFNIKIEGSILALLLVYLSGNLCFFGLSILISSKTANTQVGNGLISLITTPMMVMSGIFFSYHNFPPFLVKVVQVFPLTRLADEIRSIMIEGAGLMESIDGILILSTFGLITFFIGLRIYKWY